MARVNDRIDGWKRNLIDLTRRNRLLFFTPTRSSSLHVLEPSPAEVFQRLVIEEKPWRVFIPREENEEQSEQASELPLSITSNPGEGGSGPREPERRPNELLCTGRGARGLRIILRNLHRRSRSDFEERGVRILHMVFGILEWQETDESERAQSPLVLVPSLMSRASANDPFELSASEEEIVLNPAIDVKLWNDFRIKLASLPDDWEERGLDGYLDEIEAQVQPRGWAVRRECRIGLFSFHKLVIYQDLNSHAELMTQHPIVRALAGESKIVDIANGNPPDPRDLDASVNPKESYLVADADSSQLACIEAVKRGSNLVIQGPPGTGKSQTITNLVAESIAAGRTVLFVSEKMAALEVVYKRLLDVNLGHYCLELHSHKASKREVARQLYDCYLESLQPKTVMTELEFQQLIDRRNQLNDYVNALHLIREPMRRSAFSVLAELSELHSVPFVAPGDVQSEALTPARMDGAGQLARRLGNVWRVVAEGDRFPWLGCKATSYGFETRVTLQLLLEDCEEALNKLVNAGEQLADSLGIAGPTSLEDAEWLLETGVLLHEGPGIELCWLASPGVDPFITEAEAYSSFSLRHRAQKEELGHRYAESFFQLPAALRDELGRALESVSVALGRAVHHDRAIVSQRRAFFHWVRDLIDRLDEWERDAGVLCNLLDLPGKHQIEHLQRLLQIVELCGRGERPERKWFDPQCLEEVREALPRLCRNHNARAAARAQLFEAYEESFLSLDLEFYLEAFSARFASSLRWLRPGFYRLRREIRRCRRDGRNPADILKDIRAARDLLQLEANIEAASRSASELLGSWYRGYDTEFARTEEAVRVAKEILDLAGGNPSPALIGQACLGSIPSHELQQIAGRLKESLATWEEQTAALVRLLPLSRLPSTKLPISQSQLRDVFAWAMELEEPLRRAVSSLDAVESSLLSQIERTPVEILADLDGLAALRNLESQILCEAERLRGTYGERFAGLGTNWNDVLVALEWARRFREHCGERTLSEKVLQIAHRGSAAAPRVDPLRYGIREFQEAFKQFAANFERASEVPRLEPPPTTEEQALADMGSRPAIDGRPLVKCVFDEVRQQLRVMRERVDEVRDWIDYKVLEKDFQRAHLHQLHAEVARRPFFRHDQLPDIVRRALLQNWVDWVFRQEPALERFRAEDHETLIAEFRELDRKHWRVGAHRVISEAELRKPKDLVQPHGSEASVLFREANKRKRHLPIRRLFTGMPKLLTRLKPCLLMSPLSVSQFLDPQQVHFDLVIFDEASQICSEDAVGAIYRGRQLVVCGDNKQLPPTAFFEQGMSDEFENQDADEAFDVFDSILDECVSIAQMPQSWLRWHYRSRHESLIAFSNHRFYGNRLVTFPASRGEHPSLGIQFEFVSDGVYDRGGRRDNPKEAEKVINLVVQHFLENPKRSLGVVAFSVAQMNAIEDRLEYLLRGRPELERFFAPDRLEGFFVKNLESVQGDERDVIIFSVGYGRDLQGRLTMHFGPLNVEGGERRLNVVITRAREKVIVVSSIRAADLDLTATQKPGVLALYHYLDYAERGSEALGLHHPGPSGDFESPLERNVAATIRALGYEVVPQVGCSGYRIDLGVVDPTEPGRFFLGVECDGATYHSTYTARDRDRLRQEQLGRLGWRIHRIWAPDWVSRRETEVRRLRGAIEKALAPVDASIDQATGREEPGMANGPIVNRSQPPPAEDPQNLAKWAVPYKAWRPRITPPPVFQFHKPAARHILAMILKEVIDHEGPVHLEIAARRIADRGGLRRVGRRITNAVEAALGGLIETGAATRRGKFVWPQTSEFSLQVRRPDAADKNTIREIDFIPPEELELAIKHLVSDALSISEDHLMMQVARVFGFNRTGAVIRERMGAIVSQMIQQQVLIRKTDRVSLVDNFSFGGLQP